LEELVEFASCSLLTFETFAVLVLTYGAYLEALSALPVFRLSSGDFTHSHPFATTPTAFPERPGFVKGELNFALFGFTQASA
jgi:hypothetical protein